MPYSCSHCCKWCCGTANISRIKSRWHRAEPGTLGHADIHSECPRRDPCDAYAYIARSRYSSRSQLAPGLLFDRCGSVRPSIIADDHTYQPE